MIWTLEARVALPRRASGLPARATKHAIQLCFNRPLEKIRIQKRPDMQIQIEWAFLMVLLPAICVEFEMTGNICLGIRTAA